MEELRVISQNKMEELRVGPTSKGKKNAFLYEFFYNAWRCVGRHLPINSSTKKFNCNGA